jgi:hypothetical protein
VFTTDRWGLNFFGLLPLAPPTGRCALAELLEPPGPCEAWQRSLMALKPAVIQNERLSRADCGNRRRFAIAVGEGGSLPLKFAQRRQFHFG